MTTFIEDFNYFLSTLVFPFFNNFFNLILSSVLGKIILFLLLISLFTFLIVGFIHKKGDL